MNKGETIIDIENLYFSYVDEETSSRTEILNGIDMQIKRGEFVAVLGHNGSGKSTLAKHINAILMPEKGRVVVLGMDTSEEDKLFDIRSRVGMVFQNPDNQMVATIVEEDVAFAPENMGLAREEIRKRVDESLAVVGMSEFTRHAPHMLSGGQKQRIAIAGVLAMRPEIIVLDEPTAMLDPSGRQEIVETMHKMNLENDITVVLITHYMEEAATADRVVVIDDGRIALEGAPHEVFSQVEKMKELGLDVPQATELVYLLNKGGAGLHGSVLNEEECADAIYEKLGGKID